jgi:hypothetical protein
LAGKIKVLSFQTHEILIHVMPHRPKTRNRVPCRKELRKGTEFLGGTEDWTGAGFLGDPQAA